MPHIHTQPGQHDVTASAFIIRTDTNQPKLILHRHKKLGTYLQFGGHVELNENPWQSIAHEVREESGYLISQLKLLQPKDSLKSLTGVCLHPSPVCLMTHSFDSTHKHIDIEFAFIVSEAPKQSLAAGESSDIREFTRTELLKLPKASIPENVRQLGLFIFDTCLSKWEVVDTDAFSLDLPRINSD